jgi:hypothetical protein
LPLFPIKGNQAIAVEGAQKLSEEKRVPPSLGLQKRRQWHRRRLITVQGIPHQLSDFGQRQGL